MGWKRLECNSVLKFQGVQESNFSSIWRRFAVIEIQSKFFDDVAYEKLPENPARYGFFRRDPTAKEFLNSPAAILAGHKIQWGWEHRHTRETCQRILYEYVNGGHDGGVTQRVMREACKLPDMTTKEMANPVLMLRPAPLNPAPSSAPAAIPVSDAREGGDDDAHWLLQASLHFARDMNLKGLKYFTPGHYRQARWPGHVKLPKTVKKPMVWNMFVDSPHWRSVGPKSNCDVNLIPVITFKNDVGVVLTPPGSETAPVRGPPHPLWKSTTQGSS